MKTPIHLYILAICAIALAVPRFQAQQTTPPKPPADIKFIDPHVHAMAVTPLGLRAVAKWMDERNVERCIISPHNHKGSRPQTEEERETMLANLFGHSNPPLARGEIARHPREEEPVKRQHRQPIQPS